MFATPSQKLVSHNCYNMAQCVNCISSNSSGSNAVCPQMSVVRVTRAGSELTQGANTSLSTANHLLNYWGAGAEEIIAPISTFCFVSAFPINVVNVTALLHPTCVCVCSFILICYTRSGNASMFVTGEGM